MRAPSHPQPKSSVQSNLTLTIKLFVIIGAVVFLIWFVDQWTLGL